MPPAASDPLAPLAALESNEPGPLYWIFGKERFLVDRAVAILKERVLDPRTRDFNYEMVYAKEIAAAKIAQLARTLPMMAKRRLILVRDADALDAKELEGLASYVAAPAPETCLVLVSEKVDTRMKFFTAWKKRGELIKFEPLAERQLPGFVRAELKRRKLRCAPEAAQLIVDEVGSDLGQLVQAVERLALYANGRDVGADDVEAVIATTRTRSIYELTDSIGAGDAARALGAVASLMRAQEAPLKVLAIVARHVRQLLLVRGLLDERGGRANLGEALGLPPFLVDKLEAQARRWTATQLTLAHRAVFRADHAMKTDSKVDDERLLEALVLELTRRRPQPARARG